MFLIVYTIFLNPKQIITIMIDIIIFKKIFKIGLEVKKKINSDNVPNNDDARSFFKFVCLLKRTAKENSNNKSKRKFSINIKSIYISIFLTHYIVILSLIKMCRKKEL